MTDNCDLDKGSEAPPIPALDLWLIPGQQFQKRAAIISVIAGLIWPLQAGLVAFGIGGLLTGVDVSPVVLGLGFIVLGGVKAILSFFAESQSETAAESVIFNIRSKIVETEQKQASANPYGGAGSISALANEKLELLAPYIKRYAPAKARVMVVPIVILAFALSQSWAVAFIFIISGPLIPVFMALVGLAAKEASRRQMTEIGTLNDLLVERLTALFDIRLLGATDVVKSGFAVKTQDLRDKTMAVLRVAFLSSTVLELFAAIGVAMVAVYVGFSLLGAISFGTWGAPLSVQAGLFLLLLAPEFYQPMRDLSGAWHDKASADAVIEDLTRWDACSSASLLGTGAIAVPLTGAPSIVLTDCILPGSLRLADINIAPGESVALVGPSGSGKTSALKLIAGLILPVTGTVEVAGHILDTANADAWRARIGWMPQAPHFLSASLRHNLTLGRDGDLAAALKQASIDDVVSALPHGLNTRLGETGGGLSGGEARRLTLARAIYGAPDVILADEPTADLDEVTAKAVMEGLLAQAGRGATLVVATHDTQLAARMDRIIQIGGQI